MGIINSLQSFAYHNDSQIAELHAARYDTEPKAARVEVEITEL